MAWAPTIDVGDSNNKIIGNDGKATFDPTTGKLTSIATQDPAFGGNATINVSGGTNVVLGGTGKDQITIGGGGNVILGDNGLADFTPAGILTFITTSDQTHFGDNVITVNGDGNNVIFGGSGADSITVNGNGRNVILGDSGDATRRDQRQSHQDRDDRRGRGGVGQTPSQESTTAARSTAVRHHQGGRR